MAAVERTAKPPQSPPLREATPATYSELANGDDSCAVYGVDPRPSLPGDLSPQGTDGAEATQNLTIHVRC